MSQDTLILIPAKGASTRVKQKNMRLLGGKPLLNWAIDVAKATSITPNILISTEDEAIARHAESEGVEALLRPEKLAVDPAGVVDVALHALATLRSEGREFKTLIILLPTCPFRTAEDITAALQLFNEKSAKFLMSVFQYTDTPFAALLKDEDDLLTPVFAEHVGKKFQELPFAYKANGAIHVLDVCAFEAAKSYYAQPLLAYVMTHYHSVDIDTEQDLEYAEFLLNKGLHL